MGLGETRNRECARQLPGVNLFIAIIIMNNFHSSVHELLFSESRMLCSTPFDSEAPSFSPELHYEFVGWNRGCGVNNEENATFVALTAAEILIFYHA